MTTAYFVCAHLNPQTGRQCEFVGEADYIEADSTDVAYSNLDRVAWGHFFDVHANQVMMAHRPPIGHHCTTRKPPR